MRFTLSQEHFNAEKALEHYNRALEVRPNDVMGLLNRGGKFLWQVYIMRGFIISEDVVAVIGHTMPAPLAYLFLLISIYIPDVITAIHRALEHVQESLEDIQTAVNVAEEVDSVKFTKVIAAYVIQTS